MMKKATWATLAAMMWSGAAFAANEENLEVQSTNLTLDFEGRAVLYTVQANSTITIAQYVAMTDIEAAHDYDTLTTNTAFADGSTAGWRGCTGLNMCFDSSTSGASGSTTEQAAAYGDTHKADAPGQWHTEGVVSDEDQQLTGYVQECNNSNFGVGSGNTCGALDQGSRLFWIHNSDTGVSEPSFSGTANADGGFVQFDSAGGSGTDVPGENDALAGAPAASGSVQKVLYDFLYSGEFQVNYDLVVELSVKHQDTGDDKFFKLFQVIWGHDSDDTGGADMAAETSTLSIAASN